MSTKVYNGYVFKDNNNIQFNDFFNKFESIKNKINHLHKMEMLNELYFDHICHKDHTTLDTIEFFDIEMQNTYNRRTSFIIFPEYDGSLYCMVYGEQSDTKLIVDEFNLAPYFYYDNTDKPDNISEENWNLRDTIWGNILGGNYRASPNVAGLNFEIFTSVFHLTQDDFETFKNNADKNEFKNKVLENKIWEQNYRERLSRIREIIRQMPEDERQRELNSIELNWDFSFPESFEFKNDSSFKICDLTKHSLNDVILEINTLYDNKIIGLKNSFKEIYSDISSKDYLRNKDKRNKENEIVKIKRTENGFSIFNETVLVDNVILDLSSSFNVFKEVDMERLLYMYFFDRNQELAKQRKAK